MTFNRAARRDMARRLKARHLDVIVLRGGPMDGWTVSSTAPVLRPGWESPVPGQVGHYQLKRAEATAVWVDA